MREDSLRKVLVILIALMVCFIAFMLGSISEQNRIDQIVAESTSGSVANGMPLDAIQYAAPTWMPDARQVFEVKDRKSNAKWWVMRTSGDKWLVLPIEGSSVDVG